MRYLATVKRVSKGRWAENKHHRDTFEMEWNRGKRIKMNNSQGRLGWYVDEQGYSYHVSWLKDIVEIDK